MSDVLVSSVFEFNHEIIKMPKELPLQPLSSELKDWYLAAMNEEISEFIQAWQEDDIVGQIDALLDKIYFAIGRLQQMGLTAEQTVSCFKAVHEANMTKKRGAQAKRGGIEADAVKPENWLSPEARIRNILFGR